MSRELKAELRHTKTRADLRQLRGNRKIPGIVYGHGIKNRDILMNYADFERLLKDVGTSSMINLHIDGVQGVIPVIVSEVQRHPVNSRYIHVDLHQVRMDEKVKTELHLNFVGESLAVKTLGASLIIGKDHLNIECLPKDLISSVDVDISVLEQLDSSIHIRDLHVPAGITVLDNLDDSIVSALAPRQEKAEEAAPVEAEAEVIGEQKEGEEGAAAAAEQSAEETKKEKKAKE